MPPLSLPLEILAHIFSYGTLADTLRASWVSRAWRVAAISTPSLWTCIDYKNIKFRNIQLKRCGALTVELNLPVRNLLGVLRLKAPPSDLLSRAHSITNLVSLTSLSYVNVSRLRSLHLFNNDYASIPSWIQLETPALLHLCISMRNSEFTGHSMRIRSLQTLHLHIRVAKIAILFSCIAETPRLQELLVQWSPGTIEEQLVPAEFPRILANLKRIYLVHSPRPFLMTFLTYFEPSQNTNIYISPQGLASDYGVLDLMHHQTTHTLWIDQYQSSLIFDHGTSATKIAKAILISASFWGFPKGVDLGNITSLIVATGPPPTSNDLKHLINLSSLSFAFEPAPLGVERASLAETLNEDLAKDCSCLQELVVVFQRPQNTDAISQDWVVETVLSFLEAWLLEYDLVFGTVRICDRIEPQRWSPQLDIFSSISWLFELQDVDLKAQAPAFPEPRYFVPEQYSFT